MPKGEKHQDKLHQLARSLKDLHLASTMEEALKRAKEVLGGEDDGKSIKDLMEEASGVIKKDAKAAEKETAKSRKELDAASHCIEDETDQEIASAKRDQKAAKKVQVSLDTTSKLHKLEKGDTNDALHEVDDINCAVKDVDTIVKQAERVQKKGKK